MLSQLIPTVSGSWTPSLAFATPGTSSWAYATQSGSYRRQGSLVTVTFDLVFTPTIGTGSGGLQLSTLPYAATATANLVGIIRAISSQFTWPASTTMIAPQGASTTSLNFPCMGSAVGATSIGASNMTTGVEHTLSGSVTYIAA